MKSVTFATRATAIATAAFAVGLIFNVAAGALFIVAVSAFMTLTVVRDYARPARRWQPKVTAARRSPQRLRLAA